MLEEGAERNKTTLDYLSYLICRYHWKNADELSQVYIEAYRFMTSIVEASNRRVNVQFYNQAFIRVLSYYDSVESIAGLFDNANYEELFSTMDMPWVAEFRALKGYKEFTVSQKLMVLSELLKAISLENVGKIFDEAQRTMIERLQEDIARLYDIQLKNSKIDYFISYSRRDYGEVIKLKAALEKEHKIVWFDVDNLEMGRFRTQILMAIYKSDVVLFMMSQNVFNRIESIYELEFIPAKDLKKDVLPVWIGEEKWRLEDIEDKYQYDKENKDYKRLLEYYIGIKGEEAIPFNSDKSLMCESILKKTNKMIKS